MNNTRIIKFVTIILFVCAIIYASIQSYNTQVKFEKEQEIRLQKLLDRYEDDSLEVEYFNKHYKISQDSATVRKKLE